MQEKQKQQLTGLLAVVTLLVGVIFTLLPRLAAWGFGLPKEAAKHTGVQVALRALGIRDVALAIALANSREKAGMRRFALRLFCLCMAVDALACLPAIFKPQKSPITTLGGLSSVGLAIVSWIASNEKEK